MYNREKPCPNGRKLFIFVHMSDEKAMNSLSSADLNFKSLSATVAAVHIKQAVYMKSLVYMKDIMFLKGSANDARLFFP